MRILIEKDSVSIRDREVHIVVDVPRGTFRVVLGRLQGYEETEYWVYSMRGRVPLGTFERKGTHHELSENWLKKQVNIVLNEYDRAAKELPESDAAMRKGKLPL